MVVGEVKKILFSQPQSPKRKKRTQTNNNIKTGVITNEKNTRISLEELSGNHQRQC
jgi:hypothetical protein